MKTKTKMKFSPIWVLVIFISFFSSFTPAEIIEEIVAVVNGEIITHSELMNAQAQWMNEYKQKFQGEELEKALKGMKENLLDSFIERKLIISKAKEKNYDLENDVEIMIKEIKKQNNLSSDEELKAALRREGIDYNEWREQQKLMRMQQRLIYEEVTAGIEVDNAEIMEYFKKNIREYTKPLELSLNCIYLDPGQFSDAEALEEKTGAIDAELAEGDFKDVAKKHSQLTGSEDNIFLGNFKKGELDGKIEEAALKLAEGEHTPWIETETGWYIVQLTKRTESSLVEYKEVSEKIQNQIKEEKFQAAFKEYMEQLKAESHIEIYKKDL